MTGCKAVDKAKGGRWTHFPFGLFNCTNIKGISIMASKEAVKPLKLEGHLVNASTGLLVNARIK